MSEEENIEESKIMMENSTFAQKKIFERAHLITFKKNIFHSIK